MKKPVIIVLGKLPPPYMGPAIATKIILNSTLNNSYTLIHLDTRAYDSLNEIGAWSIKKLRRNLSKYAELHKLIGIHQPSLVWIPISQTTTGFFKDSIYIWIAILHKKKTVLHLRGSNFHNWIRSASLPVRLFAGFTLRKCNAVIVLGNKLKKIFTDYFKEECIHVVPNGADFAIQNNHVYVNQSVRILCIANLQASKGVEDILQALILLKKTHGGKFSLDIIGGWRSEETKISIEKIIGDHQLPVSIHTPETNPDKFRFLSEADIFVFTPRAPEGHPWVIVEAMAAGLPIISTDQGAITESVKHEKNGYIINTHDPSQIAAALKKLIESPELRQRMGAESRKNYNEDFTEARMVERLERAFDLILHN